MCEISSRYVVVKKLPEPKIEGFQTVDIQDDFIYKGMVTLLPSNPVFIGNKQLEHGDTVIFAKYSPDTHEIEDDSKKVKFIRVEDLLAIL